MTEPLLAADRVTVEVDGRAVVCDVALSLAAGDTVALVGPNGAGKTTLLRALLGLIPAQATIRLSGAAADARRRARQIAYLPQGHTVAWPLPVSTVVGLGRAPFADAFGRLSSDDLHAVETALTATGLAEFAARAVDTLSGGERARVALARVLATGAPVILADEPTAALDPRHQLMVMDLLAAHAARGGAVLVVVHDLALARRFAKRVMVMQDGRLIADGPVDDVLTGERIAAVFGVETQTTPDGALVPWRVR